MKSKDIVLSPVRKVRTDELLPGMLTNSDNEFAVVITVGEQEKIVNFCSKQYELMDNEFVLASFENSLRDSGIEFKRKFSQHQWSRFYIDYLIESEELKMGKIDTLVPKIRIINSYDGKVRLTTQFGLYRLVCKNGMMAPVGKEVNTKLTHTPSIYGEEGFKSIVSSFEEFSKKGLKLLEPFKLLREHKFSASDLDRKVEAVIDGTRFPKRSAELVIDRVQREMKLLNAPAPNDWLLYNGFNYQLNHNRDTMKMDEERRYALDEEVLNFLLAE